MGMINNNGVRITSKALNTQSQSIGIINIRDYHLKVLWWEVGVNFGKLKLLLVCSKGISTFLTMLFMEDSIKCYLQKQKKSMELHNQKFYQWLYCQC